MPFHAHKSRTVASLAAPKDLYRTLILHLIEYLEFLIGFYFEEKSDTGPITLVFSNNPFELKQWKIVDPQSVEVTLSLYDAQKDIVRYVDKNSSIDLDSVTPLKLATSYDVSLCEWYLGYNVYPELSCE